MASPVIKAMDPAGEFRRSPCKSWAEKTGLSSVLRDSALTGRRGELSYRGGNWGMPVNGGPSTELVSGVSCLGEVPQLAEEGVAVATDFVNRGQGRPKGGTSQSPEDGHLANSMLLL